MTSRYFPITFKASTMLDSVAKCTGACFFSFKIPVFTGLQLLLLNKDLFKLETRLLTFRAKSLSIQKNYFPLPYAVVCCLMSLEHLNLRVVQK